MIIEMMLPIIPKIATILIKYPHIIFSNVDCSLGASGVLGRPKKDKKKSYSFTFTLLVSIEVLIIAFKHRIHMTLRRKKDNFMKKREN